MEDVRDLQGDRDKSMFLRNPFYLVRKKKLSL
jgi:hypothetical protein